MSEMDGNARTASRRRAITATLLFGVVFGMIGLSFAAVPLYRTFCQATGYDGTPRTAGVERSDRIIDRLVRVRFDANVNPALPWQFAPGQRSVEVKLGAETLVHYTARNTSDRPITGTATFSVVPEKAAQYFTKIQCFCFTEQTLAPGETVEMPVVFYIDPALDTDPDARDVREFTLSYTFFPAESDSKRSPLVGTADQTTKTEGVGG